MFDLESAIAEQQLTSGTKLAEAILERLRENDSTAELPKARSLGAKISELRRGRLTWWRNNEAATRALAEVLDCEPRDILRDASAVAGETIAFKEMPSLRPLAPGEQPCVLSPAGWLLDALRLNEAIPCLWVAAEPGAGKRLAIRYIEAHPHPGPVRAVAVASLRDALDYLHESSTLVVRVEHADATTDQAALHKLVERTAPTRVLAPFGLPTGTRGWHTHLWVPKGDWRRAFIQWVHERLGAHRELLDARQAIDLVNQLDPDCELFSTPGELLSFLAVVAEKGPHVRRIARAAASWLDLSLRSVDEESHWSRQRDRKELKKVVRARLEQIELPWAPLGLSDWHALGAGDETIERLAQHGVLRTCGAETYEIYPRWAGDGLATASIEDDVRDAASERWGLWAVDVTRRSLVDRALDGLSQPALLEVVRRASTLDTLALEQVGAIEATFAAVGRRIQDGWEPGPATMPALTQLGRLQIALLLSTGPDLEHRPLTRTSAKNDAEWMQWLAEAWVYSATVPMDGAVDAALVFHLPGWAQELDLGNAPPWIPFVTNDEAEHVRDGVVRMLNAARRIVSLKVRGEVPERHLGLLLPAIVLEAPALGLHTPGEMFDQLFGTTSHRVLVHALQHESRPRAADVAAYLWQLALADHPDAAIAVRRFRGSPLLAVVLEKIEPEAFSQSLRDRVFSDLDAVLGVLPEGLRAAALRAWARSTDPVLMSWSAFDQLLRATGVSDIDLLSDLAGGRHAMVSVNAKKRLWQLVPAAALAKTQEDLAANADGALDWFFAAPPAATRDLVPLLSAAVPAIAPTLARRWLASALPHARNQMAVAHDLMQRLSAREGA